MVNKTHIFPETIPQIFHKTMDKKLFESKIDSTNQLQKEQQRRNECPKFYLLVSGRRPWIVGMSLSASFLNGHLVFL